MADRPILPSAPHIFCVPPHTHALLRYRVHRVTGSHISYFTESGVAVDRLTGAVLAASRSHRKSGPVRVVARSKIDNTRAFEGVAPQSATYYSSFAAFQALQELALIRYGTRPEEEIATEIELDLLRQKMMDAHPDRGGSEAAFLDARTAFEAARKRLRPTD